MLIRCSAEPGIGKCIIVTLDHEDDDVTLEQQQMLLSSIGTASVRPGFPPTVRCAMSVVNFRKIREMFPYAKRDRDHEITTNLVSKLRKEKELYDEDSVRGLRAKQGESFGPEYEFKLPPFEHQRIGWSFLHAVKNPALLGDCGVGKTFIAGTWADSIIKAGKPTMFLVTCPVSIIKHAWIADLIKFTDLKATRLHEPSSYKKKERVAARFAEDSDVYIINPEALIRSEKQMKALIRRQKKAGKELILIIDESSKMKSEGSKAFKMVKAIRAFASRAVIMTGTPAPNGIPDLWSQFFLLDQGMTLQPKSVDYRHDTMVSFKMKTHNKDDKGNRISITRWAPKAGVANSVYKTIEPHMIRFRSEDCIDLPDKQFLRRDVEMTKEQKSSYAEMRDHLFTEIEGEGVTARIAAVRLMKLRQVTGGFLTTDTGKATAINKDTPKMLALDDILDQVVGRRLGDVGRKPTKAIIWAQYKWECQALNRRYKKYGARGLYGGISHSKRDDNIEAFMNDDKCTVLVCHPGAAGHGLTLTAANYAIYYSLSYNWDEFYQSARRIARPGQMRPMFFYFLMVKGTIDEVIVKALQKKKNVSDIITDGPFRRDILDSIQLPGDQSIDISLEAA